MEQEVMKVLQAWFDEERGNRVTSNNTEALARKLVQVLNPPQEANDEQNSGVTG